MIEAPLFTVIVLCYRKFNFLFDAIDSVLSQDYSNIELIISDDGSPSFPNNEIRSYIETHKGKNITNLIIRQEPSNSGTVRHLNHTIENCHGKYIVALAGDDAFYNEYTLSSYAKGFLNAPRNCYIEMAQTAMYDSDLKKLESYYLKAPVQKAIEKTEYGSQDLLKMLLKYEACLPSTSTCFKREFFEKFGKFNEEYTIVEDYPMHIRLAEEGWIIHYENFIAIKHRHGGISHGQEQAVRKSVICYYTDFQRSLEDCLLPRVSVLDPIDQKDVKYRTARELLWIRFYLARLRHQIGKIILMGLRHPLLSFSLSLDKFTPVAYALRKYLFFPMLILLAFSPVMAQMTTLLLPVSVNLMGYFFSLLRQIVCMIWFISYIISLMSNFKQRIATYSGKWLSIN